MNVSEALETYENGNISEFKEWLNNEASKRDIIHITYLWLESQKPFLKLKEYIEE